MLAFIKQTTLLLTTLLLLACDNSEQKTKEEQKIAEQLEEAHEMKKADQLEDENEFETDRIIKKHNAHNGWDSLIPFTFVLQEIFVEQNRPMTFEGQVVDIIKSDSTYTLKVTQKNEIKKMFGSEYIENNLEKFNELYNSNYIALISVSKPIFNNIEVKLKSNNYGLYGCFIIDVKNIQTILAFPNSSNNKCSECNNYSDTQRDENFTVIEGDLLDIHLTKIE